jgi:hypothetical protein
MLLGRRGGPLERISGREDGVRIACRALGGHWKRTGYGDDVGKAKSVGNEPYNPCHSLTAVDIGKCCGSIRTRNRFPKIQQ